MSESGFFMRVRGRVSGPYSIEALRRMVRQGLLSKVHEISSDRAIWNRASDYEDLFPMPSPRGGSVADQESILTPIAPAESMDFADTSQTPSKFRKFFYARNGQSAGPVVLPMLWTMAQSGQIGPDDPVWEQGSSTSVVARMHPALSGLFMAPPPPPAPRSNRFYLWIVITLITVVVIIVAGVVIWLSLRQKPATEKPAEDEVERRTSIHTVKHKPDVSQAVGFIVSGLQRVMPDGKTIEEPTDAGSCFAITLDGFLPINKQVVVGIDDWNADKAKHDRVLKEKVGEADAPVSAFFDPPTLVAAAPAAESQPSMVEKTAALAGEWKARFEAEKLHWIVAPPFVIAGNGTGEQLAHYRDGTLLAAERALEATYFDKPPADPILVLLFESEGPYRRLSRQWLDYANVPHYGYYRPGDHVMVMNVSTGLGTLVHELTHALIAPDFPTVPSWFNEGLASLYEQCTVGPNTITGHENWRLPALQSAIKANKLRSLKELADDPDFYGDAHRGLNYAQARYLMFYLQENGLLVRYYKTFRDGIGDDPTGMKSLEKVIAPQGMGDFEKRWRAWVLTLRYR